jgi:asparagine N-glycosylation enzyme membrane subunit Stt3
MLNLKILYFGEKRLGRSVNPKKYRIIPTYFIVIILVIALLSLLFEAYIWISSSNLPVIEVGNTTYHRGEEGYTLAMARLKSILTGLFWTSGIISLLFGTWLFFRVRKGDK